MSEENSLSHYASQYYDPAKAHEYYLRNRKLKGGTSAGPKLSKQSRQKQSEANAFVRNQVATAKKTDLTNRANEQTARLKKMQETAQATRDRIVQALTAKIDMIQKAAVVNIPDPVLNKIPANASPQQRAFLESQNQKLLAQVNQKRRAASNKANQDASRAKKVVTDSARAEIKKLGTDLHAAIAVARKNYADGRKKLQEQYKTTLNTELQNIQKKVR